MTVLDTHAWIWWLSEPARLGRAARQEITTAKRIGIPAICTLEVAMLAAKGRISLDRPAIDWLNDAMSGDRVALLPLTPAVAVKAADLQATFPGDPADRLIVASAILESASLVTKDRRIAAYPGIRGVWD